jgi:hypothetical protein
MKTLHSVVLAAAPLAAAGVLLAPAGAAAGGDAWMVTPAATASAVCMIAGLPYRTPAVTDAHGLLNGLVTFTSARPDATRAGIGNPVAATGSGRSATTVEMVMQPAGPGSPPAGDPAAPARSRSCL